MTLTAPLGARNAAIIASILEALFGEEDAGLRAFAGRADVRAFLGAAFAAIALLLMPAKRRHEGKPRKIGADRASSA